jgi:hypothetical protein
MSIVAPPVGRGQEVPTFTYRHRYRNTWGVRLREFFRLGGLGKRDGKGCLGRFPSGSSPTKRKNHRGINRPVVSILLLRADSRQEAECSSRATELRRRLCGSLLSSLLLGYFLLGCSLLRCCCLLSSLLLGYLLLRRSSFFLGHG